jgi:hypothetical protein
MHKTPYEIAQKAERYEGQANITYINRAYRCQDESHLYPINGRFDATERAIRKARQFQKEAGPVYGLEYSLLIDSLLGEIVNAEA